MRKIHDHYELMSWKAFEDFVIDLLTRIYAPDGLRVLKTPYQNDGGRDGCGSLSIGPIQEVGGQDLSIVMRLWAEVKKRSSSNVDVDDLGGHIILALENPDKVNKIIFVTNRRFTERAEKLCTQIGKRLNVGVAFIDGDLLRELESRYVVNLSQPVPGNDCYKLQVATLALEQHPTNNLVLRCGFISSVEGFLENIDVDMQVDTGEISYWVCEVEGRSLGFPIDIEVLPSDSNLHCVFLTPHKLQIDSIETRQRITAAVWSHENMRLPSTFLKLQIRSQGGGGGSTINYGAGDLLVRSTILSPMIPESRQKIIHAAAKEYLRILENSGVSCFLIEAVAGVGKTFLLQRLRHEFIGRCGREIHLDGAVDTGIDRVVQSILHQAFPLPSELVSTIHEDVLKIWLNQASHADNGLALASSLPVLFASGGIPGQDQEVVELVASVLINASITNPVVMTFEDLHKTSSAVFDFLQRLSGVLASRRRGRVFMVLTTRPRGACPDGDKLQDFGSSQARINFHRITALTRPEARSLLEQSLRGLAGSEADMIVDQVGTTPFALREVLQFLRTDGTIGLSPDGLFFLADPEGIRKAAKAGILLTATRSRLRWLAAQIGDWFDRFVLAGACLGKQFAIADALSGAVKPENCDLKHVIDLCFDHNVLSPIRVGASHDDADIAFDHDLVRNSVLLEAGEKKIRFTAGRLLTTLTGTPITHRRMLLEYLADAADACMETTEGLLQTARGRKNHSEAVQYAFLRVSLLIATGGIESKTDFLRPQLERIDEALAIVSVPELATRPSSGMMIEGLRDLLLEMEQVGMLESEIGARLITIAQLHAGYIADDFARSEFYYFDGRRLFGMNQYRNAYQAFLDAERIWPNGSESRAPELSRVRLRQAICERHLGDLDSALITMKRALRLRPRQDGSDWKLFQSVVANLGAFYMYQNQKQAAIYWSKGLRVARLAGHVDGAAHFLNDLAHISLMGQHHEESLDIINQAEAVIEKHGLRKEQLRSNILRACSFLSLGRLAAARYALSQAEDLALAHGDLRRLWRVRANLATWAELSGRPEDAVIHDLQALFHMPIRIEFDGTGTIGGRGNRVTGALINIVHRFNLMPERYMAVKDKIDEQIWQSMISLYATLAELTDPTTFAGGIGCLYQPVGDERVSRFLITE